jgi:parvulin-like peptidyl-prolyl isomerase
MLKFSVSARVFAFSGLAAVAVVVAAQQPPSPASPSNAVPGTVIPLPPGRALPVRDNGTGLEVNLPPDTVVLTIGERKITRAEFEQLLSVAAPGASTPAAKKQVAEKYGDLESLAQEARKRMLDQSDEAKQMIAIQTDTVLANTLVKKITEGAQFTELDLRAYYDGNKEEFEEAKGSHILIRFKGSSVPLKPNEKDLTEAEALAKAQDIRAKLVAGSDFATLAKAESDDVGSAAKGGELGTFKHKQMVAPFDQAAFSIPVGQVSEPVKTQFGYHLIKVTSRTSKTFEQAKPEIEKQLKPRMVKEAVEKIQAKAPVTLNEEYFAK